MRERTPEKEVILNKINETHSNNSDFQQKVCFKFYNNENL